MHSYVVHHARYLHYTINKAPLKCHCWMWHMPSHMWLQRNQSSHHTSFHAHFSVWRYLKLPCFAILMAQNSVWAALSCLAAFWQIQITTSNLYKLKTSIFVESTRSPIQMKRVIVILMKKYPECPLTCTSFMNCVLNVLYTGYQIEYVGPIFLPTYWISNRTLWPFPGKVHPGYENFFNDSVSIILVYVRFKWDKLAVVWPPKFSTTLRHIRKYWNFVN